MNTTEVENFPGFPPRGVPLINADGYSILVPAADNGFCTVVVGAGPPGTAARGGLHARCPLRPVDQYG